MFIFKIILIQNIIYNTSKKTLLKDTKLISQDKKADGSILAANHLNQILTNFSAKDPSPIRSFLQPGKYLEMLGLNLGSTIEARSVCSLENAAFYWHRNLVQWNKMDLVVEKMMGILFYEIGMCAYLCISLWTNAGHCCLFVELPFSLGNLAIYSPDQNT